MTNLAEDRFQERLDELKAQQDSRSININDRKFDHFASQLNCHPSELPGKWQANSDAVPGSMPTLTPSLQAEVCLMIGVSSLKEKRWNKGLVWLKASWEIYNNLDDLRGLAEASYQLGVGHNLASNPGLAGIYYRDVQRLFRHLGDNHKLALCHHGLGTLLIKLGRYDKAKIEFDRAFDIYQTVPAAQQVTKEIINIRFHQGITDAILSSPKNID